MKDAVAVLEISARGHVVHPAEEIAILLAEHTLHLGRRPHVEFPLDAFRIGVLGGVEAAAGPGHVAPHVGQDPLGGTAHSLVPGHLPALEVEPGEQRVVVEHLLEVRGEPLGIHRVAGETAAEMILNATRSHALEARGHHLQRFAIAGLAVAAETEREAHGVGKLRGAAEAAVAGVEPGGDRLGGLGQQIAVEGAR